jgi:hypothetical protein
VSPEQATAPPSSPSEATPDDADDLRGFHFRRLLGKPVTWIATAIAVIAAGIAGAALVGPVIGAVAAGAMFLLALLIVFAIADSKAEDAFFEAYAAGRGLALSGKSPLPAATPLLRKGDDRYAERALSGSLADGVDGVLALYTYEDETTDSEGNSETNYYRYTLGLIEVPESVAHLPELFCQRKSGLRSLEKLEDAFRHSKQRVKLESEALDKRYEIFSSPEQDQVWLRRFFSPTFIVWLGEEAPKKFAFELVGGTLCCYVNGHKENAADLDTVRAAAATVASRLREESLETS